MKDFFTRLQQLFGFTHNEVKVIIFLTGTFLLGVGIRWYTSDSRVPGGAGEFDYSASDREFTERSRKAAELFSRTHGETTKVEQKKKLSKPRLQPYSIDINTAPKDKLMDLPGIGEEYAERIILFREDNGPFATVDDLARVKGIGKKTLERLRPYITAK